jgi:hypothetical protein
MSDELLITMRDVRAAKACSRGAREFLAKHGLDYDEFLKNGLPASVIEATGDAMALDIVRIARNGRQQ